MNNKIRVLLILVILGIGGFSLFNVLTKYEGSGTPLKVNITDKGVDVEIENFKMEHQVFGRKDWELKADFAQVNNEKKLTRLTNVRVILTSKTNQKSTISADAGIMNNETQDIDLQGHVHFVASAEEFRNRFEVKEETVASDTTP